MKVNILIITSKPVSTNLRNHQENYNKNSPYTGGYSNGLVRESRKKWRERPQDQQYYEQSGEVLEDGHYRAVGKYERGYGGKAVRFSGNTYAGVTNDQRRMFLDMVYRFLTLEGINNISEIYVNGADKAIVISQLSKVGYSKFIRK